MSLDKDDRGVNFEAAEVRAAGGVVWRSGAGGLEFLLVHRPRYEDWTLPKGRLEPGERWEDAAVREVEEETGLRCALGRELSPIGYSDHRGRPKVVRYWLMEAADPQAFEPNDEVDEVRWLPSPDADRLLTYPRDRDVLAQARVSASAP